MVSRVARLSVFTAVLLIAGAPRARAQISMSGGNTSAPKLGFAYRGTPQITNGQISFADYPIVSAVDSGSAAQAAGIAVGDVILAVNGKSGREGRLFRERAPGTKYVLSIRRGEEVKEITFVMDASPATKP